LCFIAPLELQMDAINGIDQRDIRESRSDRVVESAEDVKLIRQHIREIRDGEAFKDSPRSGEFLQYIVEKAISGDVEALKERVIGAELFGRSPSYNTGEDSIVRVTASHVRKRLLRHYERNGETSEFHLSLRSGSYVPEITRHANGAGSLIPSSNTTDKPKDAPVASEALAKQRSGRIARSIWILLCLGLAVACAALAWQIHTMRTTARGWDGQPTVGAFWSGFLDPHRETVIVTTDSSISLIEDIRHEPITFDDYTSRRFLEQIQASDMVAERKEDLSEIFNHNVISFGEARVIQMLDAEIPLKYPRDIVRARVFSADQFAQNNVILLGGKKAQPWVHLFDNELNFITDYNDARSWPFVRNRNPKPGEPAIYPPAPPGLANPMVGYTTIAYLPNPNRMGHVIILAGTDSDATAAGAAFLTSESQLAKFRNALHVDRFPPFEVLLKVSRVSGAVLDSALIAYRAYPETH
jgi:hypothetical protein